MGMWTDSTFVENTKETSKKIIDDPAYDTVILLLELYVKNPKR